jgi:hypothetical protein
MAQQLQELAIHEDVEVLDVFPHLVMNCGAMQCSNIHPVYVISVVAYGTR